MSKSIEFKKLGVNLLQFVLVLIFVDISLGLGLKHIFYSQKTGKYARIIHSIDKNDADLIIMGSSHAQRHYIPEIFENKLKLSCYNSGVQGQKLIFHTTLQKIILCKSKPKIIILNIDNHWLFKDCEAYKRLADLHPFYWEYRDIIHPVISTNSNFVDLKLLPFSYQFNSTLVHILKYWILPQPDYNGYNPLYGKITPPKYIKTSTKEKDIQISKKEIDTVFFMALNNFILEAQKKQIELYFVLSPSLYPLELSKSKSYQLIKQMVEENSICMINFTNDLNFTEKYELFNDDVHLNHTGATMFSRLVSVKIDSIINNAELHNKFEIKPQLSINRD